ncbi:MAG: sodium/proton-translocating pyrophosphatase, partial [Planctomycetota bacterium]
MDCLIAAAESSRALLIVSGGLALLGLGAAVIMSTKIKAWSPGSDDMRRLNLAIRRGAMAFLRTEYSILVVFVLLMFFVLTIFVDAGGWSECGRIADEGQLGAMILGSGPEGAKGGTAICFLVGALCSVIAGFVGMRTATTANVRTTEAARTSVGDALRVAFGSGAVMGLSVVGLGLLGIVALSMWRGGGEMPDPNLIFGFSLGASSIALFARVGGGIYTKAADVGADLVGKVEAGIPEDDPRNPAVIADNVGDNVGDVAGMGADLFESYVGSIIAAMALGYAADHNELVILPVFVAALGIAASIVGTFFVRAKDETRLSGALFMGMFVASLLFAVLAAGAVFFLKVDEIRPSGASYEGTWGVYIALVGGLVLGILIGKVTEHYTSERKRHAKAIAAQSETGAATNIIHGLAVGMQSTAL